MKKKHIAAVTKAIIQTLHNGSHLESLTWNFDLSCSVTSAKNFLKDLVNEKDNKLKKLTMLGVFQLQLNRSDMRKLFADSNLEVVFWKPMYTDEESSEQNNSEDESQADESDSHSSQDEEEK